MSNVPPTDQDPIRCPTEDDLNRLQLTTLEYHLHEANPANGLIRDQTEAGAPASIAAVGLAMASISVLVERGVISREFTPLRTLGLFRDSPQGPEPTCSVRRISRSAIPTCVGRTHSSPSRRTMLRCTSDRRRDKHSRQVG